jgi:RNA polymerase sigma-70 factor (ECF subfamily)
MNEQEFAAQAEPYRRELQAHCYRMMGSVQDAEDMVQETFLRAWRARDTYEGRASFRAWLYKIATNACLDALDQRKRRVIPFTRQPVSTLGDPIPPDVTEPIWLEPYPDEMLPSSELNPEGQISAREHITLAFIAALHLLPPRQRAILILRDVLDWQANEVASLLELTVPAVKSALHRARTTLANHGGEVHLAARGLDKGTQSQLDRYVRAWETADVNALMTLLKDDATFSMPPIPSWYQGRDVVGGLVSATIFSGDANGRWRLRPTQANGQQAFGLYRQTPTGYAIYGIQVLTFVHGEIADIITFRNPALIGYFNLPENI